ncbi:MAG: type II toxin-antitoxin system HicA family toxin [Candidatus Bipolaricaulota bacterium]|nr:type II toxin-antitoxin system HicA family toxin [Candidatus Bipolaricaulota bacterium]MCS7275211.1 type II toxin-antitoxin system HicA family toxin [Candidatus Bipolaricaulota bacterium]MDW8111394.1 type II toxin-antitoxin system HicA family toxin [Candidatus Bipolaricaulota bacterium]
MVRALVRDGFRQVRQKGSHRYFYRERDDRLVEVVFHKESDTFSPKARKAMIEAAGWSLADLKRLRLIPKRDP